MNTQRRSPVLLVSLYYDRNTYSGANKRFDETGKYLKRNGYPMTVVVREGHTPVWCDKGDAIGLKSVLKGPLVRLELFLRLQSCFRSLPESVVISDFMPVPAKSLRHHVHLQLVHDLRKFTEFHGLYWAGLSRWWLTRQWRKAGKMLTVSRFTLRQLERHCGIPPRNVIVSYNGIEPSYLVKDVDTSRPVDLLYIAHFEERKNHVPLIGALAKLSEQGITPRTVLIGADHGTLAKVQERIDREGLAAHIDIRDGKLTEEDLIDLYLSSKVFVTPARYEGFGMPVIEAMASGCGVCCSDIEVFHEVAGNLAHYFDPENEADMALALQNALDEQVDRLALRAFVKDNYTWDHTLEPIHHYIQAQPELKQAKGEPRAGHTDPALHVTQPKHHTS